MITADGARVLGHPVCWRLVIKHGHLDADYVIGVDKVRMDGMHKCELLIKAGCDANNK